MSENNEAGNGLNKPVNKWKKPVDKKTWFVLVAFAIIFVVIMANRGKDNPSAQQQPAQAIRSQKLTPEQSYENTIKSQVKNIGGTDFSYKGLDWDDSGRKDGTKMVTVKINVDSFLNKDSLIRNTGTLSSDIFQQAFNSSLLVSDAIVWYYGKTTDRYGNQAEDVIISYAVTKATAQKINWSNFTKSGLCDFLKAEGRSDSDNVCVVMANIQ